MAAVYSLELQLDLSPDSTLKVQRPLLTQSAHSYLRFTPLQWKSLVTGERKQPAQDRVLGVE